MINQSIIRSLEELTQKIDLENLKSVDKDNYSKVIYEYKLNNGSIECQCLEGRSNVCLTEHQYGFVVTLNDGSKSIIGNNCIKKFDSDAQIKKDINLLRNTQRRIDKLESIKNYYENYERLLDEIEVMSKKVEDIANLKKIFIKEMGAEIKTFTRSSINLSIEGGTKRPYIDDKGRNKTEKSKASYKLGVILGKSIIDSDKVFDEFFQSWEKFCKGMNNLKALLSRVKSDEPSEKEINAYRIQLEEIDVARQKFKTIVNNWESFKENRPEDLVFAYQRPYNLVKYFLKNEDVNIKYFCQQVEDKLKIDRNFDFINIKF